MSSFEKLSNDLEDKLDGEIGNHWWKVYIASAFWSNVSTPINLLITLLSAVTAGQASTETLLSQSTFLKISITSLVVSTLNTFFRPHQQFMQNMETMKKVNEFGFQFEEIYYTNKVNEEDHHRRYEEYKKLMMEYHKFKNMMSPEQQNFITDLIYYICIKSCLRNDDKWLDIDMKYINDDDNKKKKLENVKNVKNVKNENEEENEIIV